MRVAQGRLGALDAAGKVHQRASDCVSSFSGLPRIVRYGAVAGSGVIGFVAVRKLLRLPRVLRAAAVPPSKESGLLRYLVAQLATLVLLPWLRQRMLIGPLSGAVRAWRPADAFFRWLGLGR